MKTILITGSSGLIGSEVARYFDGLGWRVVGVDNNMRREFFGADGDTTTNLARLITNTKNFHPFDIDIRNEKQIVQLFRSFSFDLVVHAAAQPSHDKAREIPVLDFEVNALATLSLLESARQYAPDAAFAFLSTNKVYGTNPNDFKFTELPTRWDYLDHGCAGVDESCSVDQTIHSVFGASKLAADVMVQEYGRYFGMKTACFRCGCVTGGAHAGAEQHGFLSYLAKCALTGKKYTVRGFKGKQVRDNVHARDVATAIWEFWMNPTRGEVFNLGGGRSNSISVLEAIDRVERLTGKKLDWEYDERVRTGDHCCYISNTAKLERFYPNWRATMSLDDILKELIGIKI